MTTRDSAPVANFYISVTTDARKKRRNYHRLDDSTKNGISITTSIPPRCLDQFEDEDWSAESITTKMEALLNISEVVNTGTHDCTEAYIYSMRSSKTQLHHFLDYIGESIWLFQREADHVSHFHRIREIQ